MRLLRGVVRRWRVLLIALTCVCVASAQAWRAWEQWRPAPHPARAFPGGVVRVGLDPARPPLAFPGPGGPAVGYEVDVAQAVANLFGLEVQWVWLGTDGLYDALASQQVDVVVAGLVNDPQRGNLVRASHPYHDVGLVLVSHMAAPVPSMSALAGRALAVPYASDADAEALRWLRRVPAFTRQPYERPADALNALRLGHADAALVEALALDVWAQQQPCGGWHRVLVVSRPTVMLVRHDRPAAQRALNHALHTLGRNGTLDALRSQWLGERAHPCTSSAASRSRRS